MFYLLFRYCTYCVSFTLFPHYRARIDYIINILYYLLCFYIIGSRATIQFDCITYILYYLSIVIFHLAVIFHSACQYIEKFWYQFFSSFPTNYNLFYSIIIISTQCEYYTLSLLIGKVE